MESWRYATLSILTHATSELSISWIGSSWSITLDCLRTGENNVHTAEKFGRKSRTKVVISNISLLKFTFWFTSLTEVITSSSKSSYSRYEPDISPSFKLSEIFLYHSARLISQIWIVLIGHYFSFTSQKCKMG